MRLRFSQLMRMRVVDSDGARVGRIRDLIAEREGQSFRSTRMLIGEAAFLERIFFRQHPQLPLHPLGIPWNLVDRIEGRTVRLRVTKAHLAAHPIPPAQDEPSAEDDAAGAGDAEDAPEGAARRGGAA